MKFKLDENLGRHSEEVLAAAGHDVSTVRQQNLQGVADGELIERCRTEGRCLVTLDLGFANPLLFLPSHYAESSFCVCDKSRQPPIWRRSCRL